MEISRLQKERAAYQPKLPIALKGAVKVSEGAPTQSVADQDDIKKLFPNTYGMPLVEFVPGEKPVECSLNVGIILVSYLTLLGASHIISTIKPTATMRFE